jgi:peptide-methionine (R)-S-oxide reductase
MVYFVHMDRSDDEWKELLTPEQYRVLREKGTESPFSGEYVDVTDDGFFHCGACGAKLFSTEAKLDSRKGPTGLQGWPAFSEVEDSAAIEFRDDASGGMNRVEVVCANCKSHLGHVFNDPSESTGKHFCINSCALNFEKDL